MTDLHINYLGQIIGFIGLLFSLFAYTHKNVFKLKLNFAISSFFWAGSYYLLKGYTSAAVISIIVLRQISGLFSDNFSVEKKVFLCLLFIFLSGVFTIYTWHGWISILPFVNNLIATIAYFFATPLELRKRLALTDFLWLINAMYLHSYMHMVSAILSICINIFTIYKIQHNQKNILPAAEV
jgi:hypothetical protein